MSEQIFLQGLEKRRAVKSAQGDALSSFREKGWQKLLEMGLPAKTHEAFRYVPLREFYLSSFEGKTAEKIDPALFSNDILPECKHSHLVFIDGKFCKEYSDISALPPQAVLLPLEEALRTHGSFLQSHLTRSLKEEKDPFAVANLVFHTQGLFLYLPPHIELAAPLQCLHIASGDEPQLIAPRLHLVVGAHSQMRLVVTAKQLASEVSHWFAPVIEIALEEGTSLDFLNLVDAFPAWHFESLRALLKKESQLNTLNVAFGGKAVRQSYRIQLKGEGSRAHLSGLNMLSGNRSAHTHATVEHEAFGAHSMQRFKGILSGVSQSSFEGKILVQPEAQKTEAYQLNNNLILSPGAVANSKPNLEVFADDVKASHGATVSQLDDDQLFYFKTRGIDPITARRLLIGGFCREMISGIPYDAILRKINLHLEAFA